MNQMRLVSLLPSATEIVCALGLTEALVGLSHDCDYPPEIRGKPVLSEAIVTTDLPSAVIDARIRSQIHKGTSVYHLDQTQLAELQPNVILTQELCTVCAPSYSLVTQAAKMLDADTKIISLEPLGLTDILENILLVGEITHREENARRLVEELRRRIERVRTQIAGATRPHVVCLEWLDPLYVAGHWVPEMVEIAGGHNVLARAREPAYIVDWKTVVSAAPDVVVVMSCGFDIERTRWEIDLLTERPGWHDLPATRSGRVFLTYGSAYFSRPGPRVVDGLEILATILHPDRFAVRLPQGAWEPL